MKSIILANRADFNQVEPLVFEFYKQKYKNKTGNTTCWSEGIDALDGSGEVLMMIDERIIDYPFTHPIIDIDGTEEKWFNKNIIFDE